MSDQIKISLQEESIWKSNCLYCRDKFREGDKIGYCPHCQAPYHVSCWDANGNKCGVLGCSNIRSQLNNVQVLTEEKRQKIVGLLEQLDQLINRDSDNQIWGFWKINSTLVQGEIPQNAYDRIMLAKQRVEVLDIFRHAKTTRTRLEVYYKNKILLEPCKDLTKQDRNLLLQEFANLRDEFSIFFSRELIRDNDEGLIRLAQSYADVYPLAELISENHHIYLNKAQQRQEIWTKLLEAIAEGNKSKVWKIYEEKKWLINSIREFYEIPKYQRAIKDAQLFVASQEYRQINHVAKSPSQLVSAVHAYTSNGGTLTAPEYQSIFESYETATMLSDINNAINQGEDFKIVSQWEMCKHRLMSLINEDQKVRIDEARSNVIILNRLRFAIKQRSYPVDEKVFKDIDPKLLTDAELKEIQLAIEGIAKLNTLHNAMMAGDLYKALLIFDKLDSETKSQVPIEMDKRLKEFQAEQIIMDQLELSLDEKRLKDFINLYTNALKQGMRMPLEKFSEKFYTIQRTLIEQYMQTIYPIKKISN